ncbi:MAG: hypothetical protein K6U75_16755 [Firmicutes bacterium]|nr:hypothetical protein [Bacillota bacterium]
MTLFAIAMGYVEAAVVVYLRALYYPVKLGALPIRFTRIPEFENRMPPSMLRTEMGREVATIVMLATLALRCRCWGCSCWLSACGTSSTTCS